MDSYSYFYDIEHSEKKMATIENSIHQSLLVDDTATIQTYNLYNCLWKSMLSVIIIVVIIIIILSILFAINHL